MTTAPTPSTPSTPLPPAARTAAPRSYLFVPGDRPERFDKAWNSAADAVILDLEDAVDMSRKEEARRAVHDWLAPDRPVYVRINAVDTAWHRDDLALLARPGLAGVMVPKAETLASELVAACAAHGKTLLPIVETAVGFENAGALARTPGVERIAFGTIDFQVDLGIEGDDDALLFFRSRLVLESRLAGIGSPVDGVTTDIADAETLRRDTERSRRFGFGAKLCIHPSQLQAVNAGFSPTEADIAWAGRVIEAIGRSNGAAVAVDGRMVDRPVVLKAERIVAMSQRAPRRR